MKPLKKYQPEKKETYFCFKPIMFLRGVICDITQLHNKKMMAVRPVADLGDG